jgi:hypothetical protein
VKSFLSFLDWLMGAFGWLRRSRIFWQRKPGRVAGARFPEDFDYQDD